MFTINITYIDLAVSQKAKVFASSYDSLDEIKERIKRVREHARKNTVALKSMDIYEGKTLIHIWTAKNGWSTLS